MMIDTSENIDTSIGLGSIQSCVIVNCEGNGMIECLQLVRPINAIMGIYPELGDCKLYDYSLQDTLTDRLSDETVYVYLRLLANNQVKNKVEVLAPAGILPLEEMPIDTDVIKRRPLDELFQIDTIICCMVSNDHWTLTIIKPKEKNIYHINPLGEQVASVKKQELKWNTYLKQRYGVSENFQILTLPHAKQSDSISCGVFCLKFAENIVNNEELLQFFPNKEIDLY
nr:uncharacterized protein LOC105847994 [Hydra vulgaris]